MSSIPPGVLAEFQATCMTRLDRLSRLILHLEGRPTDEATTLELLREAHTLKGEATVLGLEQLATLVHRIEDLLIAGRKTAFSDRTLLDLALQGLDAVQLMLTGDLAQGHSEEARGERDQFLVRLTAALKTQPTEQANTQTQIRTPAIEAVIAALPQMHADLALLMDDATHPEAGKRLPATLAKLKECAKIEDDQPLRLHLWSLESETNEAVGDGEMMFGDLGMVLVGIRVLETCLAPDLSRSARDESLAAFNAKIKFTPGEDLLSIAAAAKTKDEPNDIPPEILDGFQSSSLLRIDNLSRCLMHLEEAPDDIAVADELLRDAHTLKGDSRLVGLMDLGALVHHFEDLLLDARKQGFRARGHIDLALSGVDMIHRVLSEDLTKPMPANLAADVQRYREAIHDATHGKPAQPAQPHSTTSPETRSTPPAHTPGVHRTASPIASRPGEAHPKGTPNSVGSANQATNEDAKRREFLHVPVDRVEQLIHLSGELLLMQTQQDRVVADIRRLAHDLRLTTNRLRDEHKIDLDVAEKFTALAREIGSRVQHMRDDSFQNGLRLMELQDSVSAMQLVEIRTVFGKYPRAVRAMVRDLGKECAVELEGVEVAVDKMVLMQIEDALLHLVRNSVDHGIETPAVRTSRGKPTKGTLKLTARNKGSFVEVEVADDGGGIDAKKISARLVSKGILSPEAAAAMSEEEMLTQIFRPGFSTAETVTDISGRGVGMDVVKRQIDAMGGSIRIQTRVGEGTRFLLSLPVSASVAQAMVFRQDQGLFAMPSAMIESMLHVLPSAVLRMGDQSLLRYEQELISLHDLGGVLGFPLHIGDEPFWKVAVVRSGERRIALRVRAVIGERKLVQQASDAFLSGLSLLSGTARIEGGELVSVLNVGQLIRQAESGTSRIGTATTPAGNQGVSAPIDTPTPPEHATTRAPTQCTVLVVEDSDITRRMLVSAIGRLGYHAVEAVNGRDGLEKFASSCPDLVLTDLDMPVMTGIQLIETLRAQGHSCPLVVMTSRESEESKREALQAGASAYLLKSAHSDTRLAQVFAMLLGNANERAA